MGLRRHFKSEKQFELGIWQIVEPEAFFLEKLELSEAETDILSIKGKGKRLEWLASRLLLHWMSEREVRGECIVDEHGKPHLKDSKYDISLSHSGDLAAVIAAPFPVGVDIQKIVSKITRIESKFMRDEESESLVENTRIEHLHVYWGAKESLYKAYGKRELDFKKHLHVRPFSFDLKKGKTTATITKADYTAHFDIYYEKLEDYILVYAIAANDSSL